MVDEYLLVQKVQVLTLSNPNFVVDQATLPFLRFILENGRDFLMSMIPVDIAVAISAHQSKEVDKDSRLRIYDLVGQLAVVDRVEIDATVPGTSVYQATIWLTPEGFERSVAFSMIPSNATLLAVVNDAPIYVSQRLWEEYESNKEQQKISTDYLDEEFE